MQQDLPPTGPRGSTTPLLVALAAFAITASLGARDRSDAVVETAALERDEQRTANDSALTGRDIYGRVLENRFDSFVQTSSLSSGDRSGNIQNTRLKMWYRSFLDVDRELGDGQVLSKSVVKYLSPFEIRHTGYLVINNQDRVNDQFVYRPSARRIQRVNLRGEAVFGSDFSLEDIVPKELEDASYERLEDATEQGQPAWVIVLTPKPEVESEYSKVQIYVEKARAVPLRTRYWNDRGTEFKVMDVPVASIERKHDVWVPMQMKMRNTKLESYSQLIVDEIEPNVEIPKTDFDLRRLLSH